MTYGELLRFLHQNLNYPILLVNDDPAATLAAAQQGRLDDKVVERALTDIFKGNRCNDAQSPVERAQTISALAQLRLHSMRDDADPAEFRKVLMLSQQIDKAFDAEIINQKF